MDCAQCEVLTRVFEDVERIYAEARGRFGEFREWADPDAFSKAQVWLNEVRLDYEVARIDLERHRRMHVAPK